MQYVDIEKNYGVKLTSSMFINGTETFVLFFFYVFLTVHHSIDLFQLPT